MKELIVDISKYNDPVDYAGLKANGIEAVIVKAGGSGGVDPLFLRHATGTKAAGLFLGLYYWIDPLYDGKTQANHFCTLAENVGADFICGDIEQWWADWSKWYAWRQGKILKSAVPVVTPKQIYRVSTDFVAQVLVRLPTIRYVNYTSIVGFVNSYCRDLLPWLPNYPLWIAQYHKTGPVPDLARKTLTWAQLKAEYLPTTQPSVPVAIGQPAIWQWTGDRFTTESVDSPIDVNLFLRPESFSEWLERQAPDPAPVPPFITMQLNDHALALNVRAEPNTNCEILRVLVKTSVFCVEPGYGTWAKLYGEPGYVHSAYIRPLVT